MKRRIVQGILLVTVAAVAYLATLGCCGLFTRSGRPASLTQQLDLSPEQHRVVGQMEKEFLNQKQSSCQVLCAKRAQLIQLLKQPDPDRTAMMQLTEEISQEQTALEKITLEYLLAVNRHLEAPQRKKLMALVSEELRTACKATACGMTRGCAVTKTSHVIAGEEKQS